MSSIFLFFWSLGLPCYFSNIYTVKENCALRIADFEYQIRIYDSNNYLLTSPKADLPAYINWLENPHSKKLIADSCHIFQEISECLVPNNIETLETTLEIPSIVCFYSTNKLQEIQAKRIQLLQVLSSQMQFRLFLVLQEFPHKVYLENSTSDE